jgi:hypothetical protein
LSPSGSRVARSIGSRIPSVPNPEIEPVAPRWPGVRVLGLVAVSYLACVAVATFPVVISIGSQLPGEMTDPLEHLWILRWSRACLLEGRSPFFSEGLQYPSGVPLGYFPTMHLQAAFYLAMGLVTSNDVTCFQVIWTFGFVSTGVSSFLMAWWVTRKVGPSWLAGLGAMLCGPMLMHAHGHLETMQMGSVPLFLIAWVRFLDRPGIGRLGASAGLYLLMVAGAPYFAVLAVFPAAWYVAWSMTVAGRGERWAWLKHRAAWLTCFSILVVPGLIAIFSSQIWAARHGYPMDRPRSQFNSLGAPIWSSFVPSPRHALGRLALPEFFEATGYASRMSECSSYLGVVTLALLAYAAVRRVRFPRAGFWWSALVLTVVLSWGSHLQVGPARISLPAGWLYGVFPPFHLIRVPARFNLFAAVFAAVPASAALGDLLRRLKGPRLRNASLAGCAVLMTADLSMAPFPTASIPPMPAIYRELAGRNPDVTLVDAPMFGASEGQFFSSLWGYWQSIHRARTTAGYPGLTNVPFDSEIVPTSPWWSRRMADPSYLSDPGKERFGPVVEVDARDYAWLYLTAHRLDHVVIHQGIWIDPRYAIGSARAKALLAEAKSFEDEDVAVYDLDRLKPPARLTWLCARGWRIGRDSSSTGSFGVLRRARLAVFDPIGGRPLRVSLGQVSAFGRRRIVRMVEGDREVARWTVETGVPRDLESEPFPLGAGLHELILESDGDDRPSRYSDRLDDARTPYSLRLKEVRLLDTDRDDRGRTVPSLDAPRR